MVAVYCKLVQIGLSDSLERFRGKKPPSLGFSFKTISETEQAEFLKDGITIVNLFQLLRPFARFAFAISLRSEN
jgi:hypothetical protein